MPRYFDCPYLGAQVELTDERERYIRDKHPEVLSADHDLLLGTLAEPDFVQPDLQRRDTRRLVRWYDDLRHGKYVIVAVVSNTEQGRHWIVTAFIARRVRQGDVEWQRR